MAQIGDWEDATQARRVAPVGGRYANITTATTTVVKSGPGTLLWISINATGTSDTLTIYDNTAASGTKIGTITVTAGDTIRAFNCNFTTGLTIVSGGTPGDYTVVYR